MRSYLSHLQSIRKNQENPKAHRASSLFPVRSEERVQTRLLFMNYWQLKRQLNKIDYQLTLRDLNGKTLLIKDALVDSVKAYTIELDTLLREIGVASPFMGTVELEFFSDAPLVFPFPAVTINYYGSDFSTVVHTAQRTYNDEKDTEDNSRFTPPESGFNLIDHAGIHPFVTLINGKEPKELGDLKVEILNHKGERAHLTIPLGKATPYQLFWLNLSKYFDIQHFLKNREGTARLFIPALGAFPRLVVGNESNKTLSITHSYYDCSGESGDEHYWDECPTTWYPATLMLPLFLEKEKDTQLTFYPIFSPSHFTIDAELYTEDGILLKKIETLYDSKTDHPQTHSFKQFEKSHAKSVRLVAKPTKGTLLPSRIKLALDVSTSNGELGCNLCTNLQPSIPSLDKKPFTFKWSPLLNEKRFTSWVSIVNSSQHVDYKRDADITLTFYREKDSKTLVKTIQLPPHGSQKIQLPEDKEVAEFFDGHPGWVTATSSNPYILTYYFIESPSGNIGGDHGY